MRSVQEIDELKTLCCTAAERAKQFRIDEFSIQEKERKKISVNQLVAEIQELQDKVPTSHFFLFWGKVRKTPLPGSSARSSSPAGE